MASTIDQIGCRPYKTECILLMLKPVQTGNRDTLWNSCDFLFPHKNQSKDSDDRTYLRTVYKHCNDATLESESNGNLDINLLSLQILLVFCEIQCVASSIQGLWSIIAGIVFEL